VYCLSFLKDSFCLVNHSLPEQIACKSLLAKACLQKLFSAMGKKVTNNKGKALGSGTISNARRAKRQAQFGEPWSTSSSNWWSSANASWWEEQQEEDDADSKWQTPSDAQQGWHAADAPGDNAAASSSKQAPVTPPWKKEYGDAPWNVEQKDEEMLAKAELDEEEPPTPWKLLDTVMTEPSSTSSSDDWGKLWKGAKKVKPPSDESIVMENPIFEPSSSSAAVEAQAEAIKKALYPKVMVDWHNCLEVRGQVDEASLKKLLDAGVDVSILSWCYKNRAREVQTLAQGLADAHRLTRIETTEERTKEGGKVKLCEAWAIDVMFDDAQDICQEAYKAGMHVYPITTKWEPHVWYRKLGFQPYRSFAEAVDDFLKTYG
jgi:hypothetical protein